LISRQNHQQTIDRHLSHQRQTRLFLLSVAYRSPDQEVDFEPRTAVSKSLQLAERYDDMIMPITIAVIVIFVMNAHLSAIRSNQLERIQVALRARGR
jgi:hypothetical protein